MFFVIAIDKAVKIVYNNKCYITNVIKRGERMPPKVQITRQSIVEAGLRVVRSEGDGSLNVRRIAVELGCSTQPVMYQFKTVSELKKAVYAAADEYHSGYIMQADLSEDPLLSIGLRYIRFAAQEKNLFRFLFQSGAFESDFGSLLDNEALSPIFAMLGQETGLDSEQGKFAFSALFLAAHGAASMLANNSMEYDESYYSSLLTDVFNGIIGMMKGGEI